MYVVNMAFTFGGIWLTRISLTRFGTNCPSGLQALGRDRTKLLAWMRGWLEAEADQIPTTEQRGRVQVVDQVAIRRLQCLQLPCLF